MVGPERKWQSTQALPPQVLSVEGLSQHNFRGLDSLPLGATQHAEPAPGKTLQRLLLLCTQSASFALETSLGTHLFNNHVMALHSLCEYTKF